MSSIDLKPYLDEFDIQGTHFLDINNHTGRKDPREIIQQIEPSTYDFILWSDCPGVILSYADVKSVLLRLQQTDHSVVIICQDTKSQTSVNFNNPLGLTYEWFSVNFSHWSFFKAEDAEQPGSQVIIGVWRKPRLHLENIHGEKSAPLKIGYVVADPHEYKRWLSYIQDPLMDNGFGINALTTLSNYPVRLFQVEELSEAVASEYPILISSSHLTLLNQVRRRTPSARILAFVPELHTCNVNALQSADVDGILTSSPAVMLQGDSDLNVYFQPQLMYPELVHRAAEREGGILITGSALVEWDYPARVQLYRIVSENPGRAQEYRISTWAKDGKKETAKGRSGFRYDRYTQLLTQYDAVFFASDRWGYLVRKYYEIPGAWLGPWVGAPIMVAPQTYDSDAIGFIPGVNYLSLDLHNFWKQVEWILSQSTEVRQVAQKGHRWVIDFIHRWHTELLPRQVELILK